MKDIKSIEFEEFARFLDTLKDSRKGCFLCGDSSWRLTSSFESEVDGKTKRISHALPFSTIKDKTSSERSELMINNAFSVLVRECANCGHMSIFRYETVLTYLSKLEPDEGESNGQG